MVVCDADMYDTDNKLHANCNRNTLFDLTGQGSFYFHLGILIFAPFFNKLFEKGLENIRQWLMAILLGCQNIEQNKELNYTSIEEIIGQANKTLRLQRLSLKQSSTNKNTERILEFNAELLKVNQQSDFYYDPHTKHYTGQLKILATWCPSIRLADKGINMDYIHTTSGHPVYFNTNDNFHDLRERFNPNIENFRRLCNFKKESVLTLIIDRGIYSMDVFEDIVAMSNTHIITWEKGYEKGQWDEKASYGKGFIDKKRNNARDIKLVFYHYQENQWNKNPLMRQIKVRVLDKKWKVLIEISILTDDKIRPAEQVIELMLKRWVQENDFKYMIKHFGINQLTSYAFTEYKDLKDKIEDKVYTCKEHKILTKEIQKIRAKLKTALLRKHKFEEKHNEPSKKLSTKEQERKIKIRDNIYQLNVLLLEFEQQRRKTIKYVSKIDELIDKDYKKLDTNTKSFMDAIKILGRNIFYLSFESFKEKYNNYRDDHVLFRHLTRSPGIIDPSMNCLKVWLCPQMEYQPKVKKIISQVFDQINDTKPEIPDGSKRKFELFLKN